MQKSALYKGGTVLVSAITFAFAGFAGQALAATGTITETGPDSHNSVKIESENRCEVTNNNNVNVSNATNQQASTGDVDVSHNTTAGAGWNAAWNDWSPVTWQNHGYTYDQWHAAFMAYMSANEGNMRSNWGHMTGGAASGDASNNNSTVMNVHISNGAAGGEGSVCGGSDSDDDGSIDTTGPDSHNGVVLGTTNTSKTKNNNNVSGANRTGQNASTGNVKANGNTSAGGEGSGNAGNNNGTGAGVDIDNGGKPVDPGKGEGTPGATGSISNTGPDSANNIIFKSTNSTSVTNNNNVNTSNWTNQSSSTGDVKANGNTTVNGGASGAAGNTNGTSQGANIQN